MSLNLLLRSALIALTIAQAVLLPRGGCCCAAQRLMAMVSGSHSELPACCRVADAKNEGGSGTKQVRLVDRSEPVHGKCQCVASVCNAPQSQSPVTPEMTAHERLDHWVTAHPVLTVAIAPLSMLHGSVRYDLNLPRLGSGHDARIVLQSWRC
jgi:hypothetical protein